MFDAAMIKQCADPALKPAIVEKFVSAVGSDNPLAISITSGKRVILVPPSSTPEDAVSLIRSYLGHAVVRVGITQLPAGVGTADPSEITTEVVDPCTNIKLGTQLFGKIYRIVVKWYGAPRDEALTDAISAWKTGYFDGEYVFSQPDPGPPKANGGADSINGDQTYEGVSREGAKSQPVQQPDLETKANNPNTADIRVDLSALSGRK
jgi:hypothetical protein